MEPVKDHQGMKIIGIDNGYGNIKTTGADGNHSQSASCRRMAV